MELLRLNCVVTYLGRSPVWVALGVLPVPLRGAPRMPSENMGRGLAMGSLLEVGLSPAALRIRW